MADLLVIANGKHQSGSSAARWDEAVTKLREIFGDRLEIRYTGGRGDGESLAREALLAGATWLAAAGGDGTIHEVVNGFFDGGRNVGPDASLSFIPCGRGNDWVRTLGLPTSVRDAVASLENGKPRRVDVGHAICRDASGQTRERVFLNIAEAGLGARVLQQMNADSRLPGLRRSYVLGALAATLSYAPRRLEMVLDDGETPLSTGPLWSLIAANGRYFGAGMKCAPMARPDDGLLEVIAIGDFGKAEIALKFFTFMRGTYLNEDKVKHCSARSARLYSTEEVPLELDGEITGTLPASLEVLPHALRLRC